MSPDSYLSVFVGAKRAILFGLSCAFLSSPGQTFFISMFVGPIARELGLDAAQVGGLYMFATFGAALLLPLSGPWIDRVDLRLYAPFAILTLAAACVALAVAGGALGVFIGFLLLRHAGQGLMTHVAFTSTARHFSSQRGRALSLVAMGFPLAEGVAPAAALALLSFAGWRGGYATIAAVLALGALPWLMYLLRGQASFSRPTLGAADSGSGRGRMVRLLGGFRTLVGTRFFWLALPILLYLPFTSTALIFHIQGITEIRGWSSGLVAPGFVGYAICHAAGLLLAGGLIDRYSACAMLGVMNLPAFAGIACLGWVDAPVSLLVFLALLGTSSGLVQSVMGAVWAEAYGVAQVGTIRSFAVMLMVAGTALGPVTAGILLERGTPPPVLAAILVLAGLLAAGLAVAAKRHRPVGA